MSKFIDLTGQRFGRLSVIKRLDNDAQNSAVWLCLCDCGNTNEIQTERLKIGL